MAGPSPGTQAEGRELASTVNVLVFPFAVVWFPFASYVVVIDGDVRLTKAS